MQIMEPVHELSAQGLQVGYGVGVWIFPCFFPWIFHVTQRFPSDDSVLSKLSSGFIFSCVTPLLLLWLTPGRQAAQHHTAAHSLFLGRMGKRIIKVEVRGLMGWDQDSLLGKSKSCAWKRSKPRSSFTSSHQQAGLQPLQQSTAHHVLQLFGEERCHHSECAPNSFLLLLSMRRCGTEDPCGHSVLAAPPPRPWRTRSPLAATTTKNPKPSLLWRKPTLPQPKQRGPAAGRALLSEAGPCGASPPRGQALGARGRQWRPCGGAGGRRRWPRWGCRAAGRCAARPLPAAPGTCWRKCCTRRSRCGAALLPAGGTGIRGPGLREHGEGEAGCGCPTVRGC